MKITTVISCVGLTQTDLRRTTNAINCIGILTQTDIRLFDILDYWGSETNGVWS